jgi:L-malate glycosyltransferase
VRNELKGRPIRLVQFTRAFHYGGTEVQLLELLRGLGSGFDTRLAVLEARGPLIESVAALGYLPEEFPMHTSAARPNTALQIARLALWLRQVRADVLHVHDFYATLLAVPAGKLAGCKVIVGRLDLAHWHGRARRAVLAQLTRMADHVVANAHAIRRMLVTEERIDPSRISVIPNGLDLARFDQRRARGITAPLPDVGDSPIVLHVANMNHPVKRQEDLLEALRLARQAHPTLQVFFVGDGPRRPQLEEKARTLGLSGAAHFLGHRSDVPALYERATVGVLCSNAEGMSNAVMEGMAAGVPMVVTRVGGNPELVTDGERGWVVPPERPQALSSALDRVLKNPEHARSLGEAARRFVRESLTLQQGVEAHAEVYRKVAGVGKSTPQQSSPLTGLERSKPSSTETQAQASC